MWVAKEARAGGKKRGGKKINVKVHRLIKEKVGSQ